MRRLDSSVFPGIALMVALVCSLYSVNAEADELKKSWVSSTVENPGFEGPYQQRPGMRTGISGRIAAGWRDYSYGNVAAHYDQQTSSPHGGSSCQQVTVGSVGANSGLQIGQVTNVSGGRVYMPG